MRNPESSRILSPSQVAIIGGTGRMGKVLTRLLKRLSYSVTICSRSETKAQKVARHLGVSAGGLERAAESRIILVSVPINVIPEVCQRIVGKISRESLLVDISAVKTPVVEAVSKMLPPGLEYLSIHPLFGPGVRRFRGENVVVVKCNAGRISDSFFRKLNYAGLNIAFVTASQHDRAMAAYQVIHHFALLSLGVALEKYLGVEGLNPHLYTRSFKATLKTLKRLRPIMKTIMDIQRLNPEASNARRTFIEATLKNLKINEKIDASFNKSFKILDYA